MKEQKYMMRRMAAGLIDALIAALIVIFFMLVAEVLARNKTLEFTILFPGMFFIYLTGMELLNNGQSLGKRLMKIRVVGQNSREPSVVDFVSRNLVKIMPVLIVFIFPKIRFIAIVPAVCYLLIPILGKKKHMIHDMVGSTRVKDCKDLKKERENLPADDVISKDPDPVAEQMEELTGQDSPSILYGILGISGTYENAFLTLRGEVVMGRSHTCNLVFGEEAPGISRRHCSIAYDDVNSRYILTDLQSSFGTFLKDGSKVPTGQSVLLKEGDEFYFGKNERFRTVRKH